jgi:YidC/Oxa1 family membrane protein insertase
MDRKTLGAVVFCVVLLFLWGPLVNKLWPPIELTPEEIAAQQAQSESANPSTNEVAGPSTNSPLTDTVTRAAEPASLTGDQAEGESAATRSTLENDQVRLTFTSRSAGIELIELKEFPRFVSRRGKDHEANATLNEYGDLPVLALADDNNNYDLRVTANTLTATSTWGNGLVVTKHFTLSSNYLIQAKITIENPTDEAVLLPRHAWGVGTSTPSGSNLDARFTGLLWFDGDDKEMIADSWFDNRLLGCFPREPRPVYRGGQDNVVWGGVQNQFFTIVAIPDEPASAIVSRRVTLPEPTVEELEINPRTTRVRRGHETSLVYEGLTIPGSGKVERSFDVFAGPKEYNLLSSLSMMEGKKGLDLVMNFSGFFGFFAKPLLLSMNALHNLTGMAYGIAIVVITIIIRLVFWPLTTASTRSMKRMAKLQPQMKAIQEKYKDDPQKMQKKTLEFMRENKVNPMGSCLPMLLQLPVFFGFFTMLQSAIELRGASFLWIVDLSQPDTLFFIPGVGLPFNLMPLIMGGTMLYQAQLTPMSPGMDPAQQKIMRYMPLMFMVFLYNMSSGLTLYWSVSNVLSIIQPKLTRLNDEKAEAKAVPQANPAKALPMGKKSRKNKGGKKQ